MMRVGLYRPVHVKTLASQKRRMLLTSRQLLQTKALDIENDLLEIVRHDEVCRRLMTTPGVGPVVALTFRATVDVPSRFTSSKAVGAGFGLTPRRQQSGEIDRMGGISKRGDAMMREMFFAAALFLMTHSRKWSRRTPEKSGFGPLPEGSLSRDRLPGWSRP
jgi:transposase